MKLKILTVLSLNLILALFFMGCEQDFDNIIEKSNSAYQVTSVSPSDSIRYNEADSLVIVQISFASFAKIHSVFCDVYVSDNSKLNTSPLLLMDDGNIANGDTISNDGSFSSKIPLSTYYPNGVYNIKYFVTDEFNITRQVAVGAFYYQNGQPNIAPVISNDVVYPDSAIVTLPVIILTSVQAFDKNGILDIEKVYFIVYRPNGTTSNNQNIMYDDGNISEHGDQLAGDGIYSLLIQITPANTKGTYIFEFQAKDRSGELSNIINHSVVIQ